MLQQIWWSDETIMKIYTVEEDSYYNFIVAVFSTEKKAKAYAEKKNKEYAEGLPISERFSRYRLSDEPLELDTLD